MNLSWIIWTAAALCAVSVSPSCTKTPEPHRESSVDSTSPAPPAHRATARHEEHAHAEHEDTDLDRPIEDLFGADCEHGVKAYQCLECRYEVGVVKAPRHLFDGGLLEVVAVQRRTVAEPLRLTGQVEFDDRRVAHVSTPVQGIIRKVHVTQGDRVKRGQPLVQLDSVDGGEAQAAFLEAKGLLQLAERNHERHKALREGGVSAEKEWLRANQELDTARIRSEAARAALLRLGLNATPTNSSGRLVLRAPSGGTVLDMHAVGGEIAKPEEPLVTLGDRSTLWVWADLYERDFARVARQQAKQPLVAEITVKAFPKETFTGTVDFISPSINRNSRTVRLRVVVPNPEERLLVGMYAAVNLLIPGSEEAWAVPSCAVARDEGRTFVFIHHHEDYYVRRPVVPGRAFGEWTEIRSGLGGDEKVVANGAFLMKSDVLRSKMGAGCAD